MLSKLFRFGLVALSLCFVQVGHADQLTKYVPTPLERQLVQIPGNLSAPLFVRTQATVFTANAVKYDGTNDYLTRTSSFTGAADGSMILVNMWFRRDATGISNERLLVTASNIDFHFAVTDTMVIQLSNTSGASTIVFTSTAALTDAGWHNLQVSASTNFAAGSKLMKVALDGSAWAGTVTDVSAAFNINLAEASWAIAAYTSGVQKYNGCLAEFYLNNTYLDTTNATNNQLFRSSAGKPVSLGPTGLLPTGTLPYFYFPNAAATVNVNATGNGNMTINGAPSTCSNSPSSFLFENLPHYANDNIPLLRKAG